MRRFLVILFLFDFGLVSLCCRNDSALNLSASLPTIDGNSSYNEPYRDSIIAVSDYGIVIMHKSGTGFRQLMNGSVGSATWSPNKWKILCSDSRSIFTVNPEGGERHELSATNEKYFYAIASPSGRSIAYVTVDSTDSTGARGWIKLMNADGSGVRLLLSVDQIPNRLTWMPDSKNIVYNNYHQGILNISIDDLSTTILYQSPTGLCYYPCLSGDGSAVAFSEQSNGSNKIFLLDVASRQYHILTTGTSFDSEPSWSADGSSLAYSRAEFVPELGYWIGSSIWVIDKTGENNRRLSPASAGDCFYACWQQ